MIELSDVSKSYGKKTAVRDLSFTVLPGRVTGFLGPNGSGKSTTMRLILGLDAPDRGQVVVNGKRYRDHSAPLHQVGALLEASGVHTGRSAYDHLLAMAQTHGLGRERVEAMIELVGLAEVARKRVGGFSLGMRQRLGIASALLADPRVVMLDEPINGLDPEGILWVRNLLRGLAAEGRTVFVSSHLMSEMAVTADHLIVIGKRRADRRCRRAGDGPWRLLERGAGALARGDAPRRSRRRAAGAGARARRRSDRGARDRGRGDRRGGARGADRVARTGASSGVARGRLHGADRRVDRVPGG
ncbi:MAG TPA: ATP-binding cassette domain-containing protein [Solirubrobacterales bacterium]|nr:ATP-binding cassette domain-containing protein [Solirubrobacterales bacterium]